ncbi:MAG: dTDP-4-dehydrorhamnose 3,5-epimerase [Proteobacteria bacterium]|nr:dTDP-4-dehydrorhamnose 3,5-epimerase [Pseudomonadota bacterium]
MNVIQTELSGVLIIEPKVFGDSRGFFLETYQKQRYADAGIEYEFVQDNQSRSQRGVLRGLHFQVNKPQGKLVSVSMGEVYDVAVDINPTSETFGKYVGVSLTEDNHRQLWVPPGYAHGFVVVSETADFQYKCTDYYDPSDEAGIIWNDSQVAIDWPVQNPALSDKDKMLPTLVEYAEGLAS